MTKVTKEILEELKWKEVGNKWIHEKGVFIYSNKLPEELSDLIIIMTGTAFRKGQSKCNENETA